MTILEALASGKEFRRKSTGYDYNPNAIFYSLSKDDLLAGDWVLSESHTAVTKA